jgi:hypothetical protein
VNEIEEIDPLRQSRKKGYRMAFRHKGLSLAKYTLKAACPAPAEWVYFPHAVIQKALEALDRGQLF